MVLSFRPIPSEEKIQIILPQYLTTQAGIKSIMEKQKIPINLAMGSLSRQFCNTATRYVL